MVRVQPAGVGHVRVTKEDRLTFVGVYGHPPFSGPSIDLVEALLDGALTSYTGGVGRPDGDVVGIQFGVDGGT